MHESSELTYEGRRRVLVRPTLNLEFLMLVLQSAELLLDRRPRALLQGLVLSLHPLHHLLHQRDGLLQLRDGFSASSGLHRLSRGGRGVKRQGSSII